MNAIVSNRYGPPDVLQFQEVEKPAPGDDELLIRVYAASLNAYDWHLLTADIFLVRLMGQGVLKPKFAIPGADIAGRVEAVGRNVKQFKPGDDVYGDVGHGGFAEYVCARENKLTLKPANLSFEQAAAVPMAALTALQGLRDDGHILPHQNVLVQGASGGVGTFAVQLARFFGARVTAVCSTRNVEMARSLGADAVIDYTRQDFTCDGQQYNLILAVNGYHRLADYRRALAPGGVFVMAGGSQAQIFQSLFLSSWMSRTGDGKFVISTAKIDSADLAFLTGLLEAGRIAPVIDRCYPLSETAQALAYLGEGHARGKVVLSVANDDRTPASRA